MLPKKSARTFRLNKSKIAKRKAQLKRLHKIYSWRKMAEQIFGGEIKFGTLERFVTDPDYVPKEMELLRVLDLLPKPRSPYIMMPRWLERTPGVLRCFNHVRNQVRVMGNETREQQFSYKKKVTK